MLDGCPRLSRECLIARRPGDAGCTGSFPDAMVQAGFEHRADQVDRIVKVDRPGYTECGADASNGGAPISDDLLEADPDTGTAAAVPFRLDQGSQPKQLRVPRIQVVTVRK